MVPAQVDPVSRLGPHFFPRLFLSRNGRSGLTLTFHGSGTHCLSRQSQTERPPSYVPFGLFAFPLTPFLFQLVLSWRAPGKDPQKPNGATKNPLLSFKCPPLLNGSFLSLRPRKHIPRCPLSFSPPLPICGSITRWATAEIIKSLSSSIRLY